jgi:hypothetical protein
MVNVANLNHNFQTLSKMRTLLAILIGTVCGITNMNQILAPIAYVAFQLLATGLIAVTSGNYRRYFNNFGEIASGIPESVMMFICSWMLSYNLVYTL